MRQSKRFNIKGGMRQRCVRSPCLFRAVLHGLWNKNGEPMLETWVSTLLHGRRKLLYLSFADGWHPDFLRGGELMLVHCWTHWSNGWIRLFCSWMLTTQLSMTPSLPKALQLPLQRFSKFWPMPVTVEKKGLSSMLTSCVSLWRWRILKASSLSCACVNNTTFPRLRRKWTAALQEQSQSKSGFTKIQALKVFHKFRWVLQD